MKAIVSIAKLVVLISILLLSAPSVSAYSIDGTYIDQTGNSKAFSFYQGTYLFVDGMATDCSHCQAQHSVLEDLYASHGGKITMLSIAIWSRETHNDMQTFTEAYNTPWNWGNDPNQSFASDYGIGGTPTMILFGPEGLEITRWAGETSLAKLQADIDYILDNQIVSSNTQLPDDLGFNPSSQGPSIVEQIFTNRLFQGVSIVVIILAIYFKSMSAPAVSEGVKTLKDNSLKKK